MLRAHPTSQPALTALSFQYLNQVSLAKQFDPAHEPDGPHKFKNEGGWYQPGEFTRLLSTTLPHEPKR
jgi:hypothetical protein